MSISVLPHSSEGVMTFRLRVKARAFTKVLYNMRYLVCHPRKYGNCEVNSLPLRVLLKYIEQNINYYIVVLVTSLMEQIEFSSAL